MPNAYIRFLNLIDALDRINPGRSLDYIEIQLLEYIMQQDARKIPLLVGELIGLSHLGSQATLHGRLKNLVAMGYIKLVEDKNDARRKTVSPTKLAIKYVQFMSDCLEKSLKKL
ncbi:MAG TPA: helix-turn-helix domain-containing protein [Polynucleobacter sp.]|nr:helix-turn-helix domain-containing protein [Polynucleobacter sp.]